MTQFLKQVDDGGVLFTAEAATIDLTADVTGAQANNVLIGNSGGTVSNVPAGNVGTFLAGNSGSNAPAFRAVQATDFNGVPTGPFLPAYDPRTVPYYLDLFYDHFKARPFAVSGSYGFTGNQGSSGGTLASSTTQGGITLTLQTGQGANFTPGEVIVVGDGNVTWQSFLVNSISTDTLTVFPRVAPAGGWPSGSAVQHAWGNSSHPLTTYAYNAWGAAISNARQRRADGQPSLMPPNGAGTGNDLGSFLDNSGTINGLAHCPTGWTPLGTAANVTSTVTQYVVTQLSPNGRGGNNTAPSGIALQASTASGSGINTTVAIPVVSGRDYVLSWMGKVNAGSGHKVVVVDSTTTSIVLATYNWSTTSADMNTDSLCVRTTLQFTAPPGTTGIQIQIISQATTDNTYFSDMRLVEARESTLNDRYVIEASGNNPIVMLGDSWTYGATGSGWSAFTAAIQARLGTNVFGNPVSVINAGFPGLTVAQFTANMTAPLTDSGGTVHPPVLSYLPAYVVLGSGFQNDLAQNLSQASVQSSVASFIDVCRQNGIIPVIPGVAPTSNTAVTGEASPLQWAHDLNEAVRSQCMLVTR